MEVVDAIKLVPIGVKQRFRNLSIEPVMIETVRKIEAEQAQRLIEAEPRAAAAPQD